MIQIFETNKDFNFKPIEVTNNESEINVIVNEDIKYQKILGFGGAITESSAYIYSLLDESQKELFLKSYYSEEGLNYNLVRLTIGSCDFSLESYNYINDNGEFSLEHEKKYLIPFLNDIKKYKDLTYMCSSWSPLKEWKDNKDIYHGGHLLKNHYKDYIDYLINYLKEMYNQFNIKFDYMSIQNEPMAVQVWESCIFTPKEEAKLAYLLNKELKNNDIDTKLFIWDHNKDIIVKRVKKTLGYKSLEKDIYGIAYHWYDNGMHSELSKVHDLYPDKVLLFSEGCVEFNVFGKHSFEDGFRYAKEYINDINNYSNGFIDWNILLDEKGGPNHVGNFCEALIQYDRNSKELIFNKAYYFVKHLSHFIKKDGIRIGFLNKTSTLMTSILNEDGSIIVIILNNTKDEIINLKIKDDAISFKSEKDSIITVKYRND